MAEMIHNSVVPCFNSAAVVHHPLCGLLVCMSAAIWAFFYSPRLLSLGASGAHILCRVCCEAISRRRAQGSLPPPIDLGRTKEPGAGWGRLLCISKPAAQRPKAPVTSLLQELQTHTALDVFVHQLKCIKCKSPAGGGGGPGSGVVRCARNWNGT